MAQSHDPGMPSTQQTPVRRKDGLAPAAETCRAAPAWTLRLVVLFPGDMSSSAHSELLQGTGIE